MERFRRIMYHKVTVLGNVGTDAKLYDGINSQYSFNAPKGGNAVLTNTRLIHITILMDYVSMPRRAVMLF